MLNIYNLDANQNSFNSANFTKKKLVGKNAKLEPIFNQFNTNVKDEVWDKVEARNFQNFFNSFYDKDISNPVKKQELNFDNLHSLHSNFSKSVFIDGKVDKTLQGHEEDCWLLSSLNALSYSKEGETLISEIIKEKENGNIEVELRGAKATIEMTPQEIIKARKRLAIGDDDVIAVELAVEKYRKGLIENKTASTCPRDELSKSTGLGTKRHPLKAGFINEAFYLLTGKESKLYVPPEDQIATDKSDYIEKKSINDYLDGFSGDSKKYAGIVGFKGNNSLNFSLDHYYSIKNVDKQTVTIVNPWNTLKEIVVPRKEFTDAVYQISFYDLKQ